MKKIDAHLHLVRSLAGLNGQGRLTPLGNGRAIWDSGQVIKLIPDGWGDFLFRRSVHGPRHDDCETICWPAWCPGDEV